FFMAQDERYRQSFEDVLRICGERNTAVQVIKSIARGPWATTDRTHTTWYQPLEGQADIDRAVHWALGVPRVFLNTVGDLTLLPREGGIDARVPVPGLLRGDSGGESGLPSEARRRERSVDRVRGQGRALPPLFRDRRRGGHRRRAEAKWDSPGEGRSRDPVGHARIRHRGRSGTHAVLRR